MNGVVRSSFKLTSSCTFMNVLRQTIKPENAKQRLYSTFWNASLKSAENNTPKIVALWNKSSYASKQYATKSERELADFLEQEIDAEQKLQKNKTIPSKIDDFEVKLNGSEVTLIKSLPTETIEINFSINHSVVDEQYELSDAEEPVEVNSKPNFEIDIQRGDEHLGFTCSFLDGEVGSEDEEQTGDIFAIDEITMYKGEWKDGNNHYAVAGSIIDGNLYDLLMNMLDEKGINNEFVRKLSELSTAYEHSSYISLLRDLKKFASS